MKKIIITLSILFINLIGCSIPEPLAISNIEGNWRIFIGGEYSLLTKNISINFTDSKIFYDNILFDSSEINKNRIRAFKRFNKDSTFSIDLTLTIEKDYLWGYEIIESTRNNDSTYIFGRRIEIE